MSDTPRTDAAVVWLPSPPDGEPAPYVPVHVAVELERELNEYKRMLAEALDTIKRWEER